MRSKRVSKIDFRETRIQNLLETSTQDEFPNEHPKCVPRRYAFCGRALQNAFLGYGDASAAYPLALRGDLASELSKKWQAKARLEQVVSRVSERHFSQLPGVSLKTESGPALGCAQGVRGHTRRVYSEVSAGYPRPLWNHIFHWPSGKKTLPEKVYAKGIRGYFEIGLLLYKIQ